VTAKRALLITGHPGCGKTTLVRRLVDELGVTAGGFYTQEIRTRGRREGFGITTLDGETATLAGVHIAGGPRVARYGVNTAAMDHVASPAIERAIGDARLIVIDEIGKMELLSNRFRQAVLAALECGKPVLATVMLAAHPWADALKRRPEVSLVVLTEANRAQVAADLLAQVRQLLGEDAARPS
jgi:nucleoside-triphosphatase